MRVFGVEMVRRANEAMKRNNLQQRKQVLPDRIVEIIERISIDPERIERALSKQRRNNDRTSTRNKSKSHPG